MRISGLGLIPLLMGLSSLVFRSGWARHMARPTLGISFGSIHFWKNAELIAGTVMTIYGLVVLSGIYDPKSHLEKPFNVPVRDLSMGFAVMLSFFGVYSAIMLRSCVRAAVEEHDGILGLIPSKLTYTWIGLLLLAICFVVGGLSLMGLIDLVL